MASPWISPQQHRPPVDRPWTGMVLLVAVPVLALILIRMLWSGSGLWFLTVGIILLGAAAVIFLARRSQEQDYTQPISSTPETSRVPLVLTGLGVLFLAMLLVPNFASGGSDSPSTVADQQQPSDLTSDVASSNQAPAQQQPQAQAEEEEPPAAVGQQNSDPVSETSSTNNTSSSDTDTDVTGETYVVADGDTLWDIATRYETTVEAIVDANDLENPADIAIGDELLIPTSDESATNAGGDEGAVEGAGAGDEGAAE